MSERESMPCDVVIVGGGPAGLAAAIRLKQLNAELEVIVLEKGSEIGAHILSGAVVDPKALDELLPDWRESCPMAEVPVTDNWHWVLSAKGKTSLPHLMMPPFMSNEGCYTGSLGNMTRWLAEQAEGLGVMVFPGFPAAEVIFDDEGAVGGVITQDMGVAADGSHKGDYQPGMEIHAKYTLFAEGARGHLTKRMKAQFDLEADCQPQVYGLGIKEIWDIDPDKHVPGRVIHTQGWPLSESESWGGGFLYHQANGQVAIGFVTALDYRNPWVSPFQEFQRWKQHPAIREFLEGGKRVAYGARAINEGGWQSVPKLAFPGGALIGCAAGFVNVPRIKGSHTAMKSGMLAAEAIAAAIGARRGEDRADGLRRGGARQLDRQRAEAGPERPARGGQVRRRHRHGGRRHRHVAALSQDADHPGVQARTRLRADRPRRPVPADRVSQARRRDQLRPADQRGVQLHQPRREPAGPPDRQGSCRCRSAASWRSTAARRSSTARRASTNGWSTKRRASRTTRSTRRTASTARPATSRTPTRTSPGPRPKAAAGRTIRICDKRRCAKPPTPRSTSRCMCGGGARMGITSSRRCSPSSMRATG